MPPIRPKLLRLLAAILTLIASGFLFRHLGQAGHVLWLVLAMTCHVFALFFAVVATIVLLALRPE